MAAGRTPRSLFPTPEIARGSAASAMRKRQEARRKLADTEKKDASG